MLQEVSKEEAKKMALNGQEVLKIYLGCDGSRVQSVNKAIDEIFDDNSRFLVDTPEEEAEPKTYKGGRKKKLKLDTGKIMALHRAGWSLNKIADEMGVSASTIQRTIAKEDEGNGDD